MRVKFEDVFQDVTKLGRKIPQEEYLEEGLYPIVDQGQREIAGYSDEEEGLFADVPALIFGDHTRIIKYVDQPFFLGADGVKLLKAHDSNANYRYLYYSLSNVRIPNTGYNRHFKWLKEAEFEMVSSEEQKRIVDILDKVSGLIAMRKKQLQKLDDLVKARFVETFGDIPESEYKTMEEVCSIITDGTHQPPKFVGAGIPFLFVSNITGNKLTYDAEKFITEQTYAELIKRTPIEIGDILLSTVGSYGHPAVVKSERKFCFQRHIAYLKPRREIVDSDYLHGVILSPIVQEQIESKVRGIAQKTLNLSEIRKIRLPVASMYEQRKFAEITVKVEESRLTIQQSTARLELLKAALLQKYFG